jgi:eukaryotic-like serine/threonine-protein kinase
LDAAQRVLRRDDEFVPLTPKAFDVLVALVESGGRVVDKEELLKRVWPDTFVEEGSLTQNISNLRKLLARSGNDPQFIQTVFKTGVPVCGSSEAARRDSLENRPRLRIPSVISRGYTYYLALLLLSVAAAFRWEYARPHPLTDKDVLVLADFINSTGDPVFDGTLREALAHQLEQSPVLKVLDDEVMRQDLQLMRRSPQERVTNELARDICLREAEKAMLAGAIARMGESYVIELKAVSCQNGTILARQQAEGADKDHVLQAPAKAAQNMRAKLGESLRSIQRLAPPRIPSHHRFT